MWRPAAGRRALQLRARLYAAIRAWFDAAGVLEVETPTISAAANTDPTIESLGVATAPKRYLRTSPEFAMKRLVASGVGPIYELGRVYRAAEQGRRHNPEFSMLEWYRPGFDLDRLVDDAVALVRLAFTTAGGAGDSLQRMEIDFVALVNEAAGLDVLAAPLAQLNQRVRQLYDVKGEMDRDQCTDLLFATASAQWPEDRLTVVRGFPASQAALARLDPERPDRALRFELFAGPIELANGYDELTDARELAARLDGENRRRLARGLAPMPLDQRLLAAQAHGLPDCCGVSVGLDRLLMSAGGFDSIDQVLAFPWSRA